VIVAETSRSSFTAVSLRFSHPVCVARALQPPPLLLRLSRQVGRARRHDKAAVPTDLTTAPPRRRLCPGAIRCQSRPTCIDALRIVIFPSFWGVDAEEG
jgi:hypothetical protein